MDPSSLHTPAEEIRGVYLTAPRVTDGLYLLPVALHPQLALAELGRGTTVPLMPPEASEGPLSLQGFSAWPGGLGDREPPILGVIRWILSEKAEALAEEAHGTSCQEACYRCLKNYENQNLHGLLDWQLGMSYLRAFVDPGWACGLDGDSSWWPSNCPRP